MSVRKLRNSWWIDLRYGGVRYRERSPENTRAGALAYEALLRQRLARGEALKPPIITKQPSERLFKDFAAEWFDTYVRTNNKPTEQRTKSIVFRVHLLPLFGNYPLQKITDVEIERYKTLKQASGLAPKTVNNHLNALSRCLRHAEEWGWLPSVPRMKPLRVPPQKFDFLTSVESARLLQDRTEPQWHEMLLVALRTGLRLGELIGLDWANIDFDRGTIIVRQSIVRGNISSPKNNRMRPVPMAREVREALAYRRREQGLVFPRPDGGPLSYNVARNAILRHCRRVGLRDLGWHDLRHTFASQLATEGVPMPAIQTLLGHSSIQMTARYAHLAPAVLQGSVELLQAAERRETQRVGQPVGNTDRFLPEPVRN